MNLKYSLWKVALEGEAPGVGQEEGSEKVGTVREEEVEAGEAGTETRSLKTEAGEVGEVGEAATARAGEVGEVGEVGEGEQKQHH